MNRDRIRQLAELLRKLDDSRNGDSKQEQADANNRAYAQAAAITGTLPDATSHEGNHSDYFRSLTQWLEDESTIYVFVYGTLKRGQGNHYLLEDSVFVEEAKVQGYGLTPGGGFPYAIPCQNFQARGEVYAVEDHTMDRLDGLEGFPYHYTRDYVDVRLACGMWVQAWIYVAAHSGRQRHRGDLVESWESIPWKSRFTEEVDDA